MLDPAMRRTLLLTLALSTLPLVAEERTQRFDRDPGWESVNNRVTSTRPRSIRQDFGYSKTTHTGGKPGEIGGFITPAAEPAYYAKKISRANLADELTASGTLTCTGRPFHVLVGFFNAGTLNEWRTPNTIALRLSGRGEVFYAWLEYATSQWRAGGDSPRSFAVTRDARTGRARPAGFLVKDRTYRWTIRYDPRGNKGHGVITATIGDQTAVCQLREGHKADGATFDRFGLMTVMKHADTGGELWLGDLTVNGKRDDLSKEPDWEGVGNRRSYSTTDIRPRFDFGFSPTQHARGESKGELGGLIFRGDCRYPPRMASYGDRLAELTLDKPMRARGKVCLRRGVTDSTVLIGFYHSKDSMRSNPAQDAGLPECFLGAAIEGPSREGFLFAPTYRVRAGRQGYATDKEVPYIYPDGTAHSWSLEYSPTGDGQIRLSLGKKTVTLALKPGDRTAGARFDRFGIVTTWIDGNGQVVYFDDLTYTCKQE
jgi:hypothetical protein